ncbi:MAG: cysteine--tRNA ligase [Deltaproteobacteria bacterium]|nr:MAG: cysteine--tRNA ligase [Deltaproteobacteria bacterium]
MPHDFRLYNTLTRKVETFAPLHEGKVGLYLCGNTVYSDAHIGHGRAMMVFDMVVRHLRARGWDVRFVRNFTDVDDKIIAAAAETGEDPLALSARFIDRYREDAAALGLVEPTVEPKVSTHIDAIIDMVSKLVERGHAYENEGTVWFSVESKADYGKLSGQKVDELRSADVGSKRNAADFALWKGAKPGEPSWDSPWGPGRPGWHIECSAMSSKHLGEVFDIHGGGLDLVFPHHENEIAQSECAHGTEPMARYWMHNGLLTMPSGQKMGKSKGNAFGIRDLLAQYPAEALRLYYLQSHYRSPLPWDPATGAQMDESLAMLARLYEAREVAEAMGGEESAEEVAAALGDDARRVLELGQSFEERFLAAMDDDFNTAQALGVTFELARAINRFANHKKAKKRGAPVVAPALKGFQQLTSSMGLLGMSTQAFLDEVKAKRLQALGVERSEIEQLLVDRTQARADKDWARADAIRDELEAKSIVVMDRADGVDWKIRLVSAEA